MPGPTMPVSHPFRRYSFSGRRSNLQSPLHFLHPAPPTMHNALSSSSRRLWLIALSLACLRGVSPAPAALAGEKVLGRTLAAHALTRGHNRKVIYDAVHGRWYVFWLKETDGTAVVQPGEGITAQWSKNGKSTLSA